MSSTKRPVGRVSKSFTGCARCKEKKKKCDESLPECRACVRAGEECPGFVQKLRWSRKHERYQQPNGHNNGAERRRIVRHRPLLQRSDRYRERAAPLETQDAAIEESPDSVSAPSLPHNDLDLMFSQWLDAEFLPRDDLPLLGLNLPLGQPSTALVSDGLIWPTMDDMQDMSNPINPYQGLDMPLDSVDCTPGDESTQFTDEDNSQLDLPLARDCGRGSCLETFYRMSIPTPYARFSSDHLIQHYFTDVCSLVSCFDSPLNPFRKLVANELTRSKTVSLAIQSMSIANLANNYLYMAPLGMAKRCEAWKSLQSDLHRHRAGQTSLETVLLSLLLLGSSASWHQPSNLGLPYLYIMRTLMQRYFRSGWSTKPLPQLKDEKFFADALMHWEMLASFLDPVPMQSFPGYGMPDLRLSDSRKRLLPHPWTGASTEIDLALAEVGRILRRRQRRAKLSTDTKDDEPPEEHEERWAVRLEDYLRTIDPPGSDQLIDYGDRETPQSDLICLSHAQRYIGLLEMYREYPHILERLKSNETELPDISDRKIGEPWEHPGYKRSLDATLCTIAMKVLEALKETSLSSSACRLLPLVLVSCSGHLRFPDQPLPGDEAQYDRHDQVIEARYFVESRMLALSTRYPQKQMLQILEIVKEVWDRLDNNEAESSHWMDVMHEKQMQTMMG